MWISFLIVVIVILCLGISSILSWFTSIFILVTAFFLFLLFGLIEESRLSKKKLKTEKPCTARLINAEGIRGYKGKMTYTFEIQINNETHIIKKKWFEKVIGLNDTFDAYPVFDEQNKVIDFKYDLESKTKISIGFIALPLVLTLFSILLVLNDATINAETITGIVVEIIFSIVGITDLHIYRISQKTSLIPVHATITSIEGSEGVDSDGIYTACYAPIYQVVVDGLIYQFRGCYTGNKAYAYSMIGKNVLVYCDKDTMTFFENPKKDSTLILAIALIFIILGIWGLCSECISLFFALYHSTPL